MPGKAALRRIRVARCMILAESRLVAADGVFLSITTETAMRRCSCLWSHTKNLFIFPRGNLFPRACHATGDGQAVLPPLLYCTAQ